MAVWNLCPHPIRLVRSGCPDVVDSLDGWVVETIPSAGAARLRVADHGTYVVYGAPEGVPACPEPGDTYVVSLTTALSLLAQGWPSSALRVTMGDIRRVDGTRAGACRRIVEPRLASLYRLVVTVGPPGCGKTHAIRQHLAARAAGSVLEVEVSRDGIRTELGYGGNADSNSAAVEAAVTRKQHARIREALAAGGSVIAGDTCQMQATMDGWVALAEEFGAQLEVWDFRGIPLDRCIAQDAARGAAGGRLVGEEAIRRVAARCARVVIPDGVRVVDMAARLGLEE